MIKATIRKLTALCYEDKPWCMFIPNEKHMDFRTWREAMDYANKYLRYARYW